MNGRPAVSRWAKPPRIVVQPPSPEWKEINDKDLSNTGMKNLKTATKNHKLGGGGELKVGDNLRYEFTAEQFVIHDSWGGNRSSPDDLGCERRSYIKPQQRRDVLNCNHDIDSMATDHEVSWR